MYAFILAAGLGTRLRPWTYLYPKPMISIFNEPILFRQLRELYKSGVKRILINTHYGSDQIQFYVDRFLYHSQLFQELTVSIIDEVEILGTGGALLGIDQQEFQGQDFLLINSDIYHEFDYKNLIKKFKKRDSEISWMVLRETENTQLKQVEMDSENWIQKIGPVFSTSYQESQLYRKYCFSGVHLISSRIFDYLGENSFQCIIRDVYSRALNNNERIKGIVDNSVWFDIGNLEGLYQAHSKIF